MIDAEPFLAIDITKENYHPGVFLSNAGTPPFEDLIRLVDGSNVRAFIQSTHFTPIIQPLKRTCLDRLTESQLIVVVYFYIHSQPYSSSLMKQWFIDCDCDVDLVDHLTETIYNARLERPQMELLDLTTRSIEPTNHSYSKKLEDALKLMDTPTYQWKFDRLPDPTLQTEQWIDLYNYKETAFLIEDHSCIVIGFTVTATELIQLVSGYNHSAIGLLSTQLPVYIRDHVSLARMLLQGKPFPDIFRTLGFKQLSFHGLDIKGKLVICNSIKQLIENRALPLFVKFKK